MVEPALSIGAIRFGIIASIMVLLAGIASLPPTRDSRVFLGAAFLFGTWVIAVGLAVVFDDWLISSSVFFLDIFYAYVFYLLSRPPKDQREPLYPNQKPIDRNWAGYVTAVFVVIVVLELSHMLANKDFFLKPLAIIGLCTFSLVIFVGFVRGFGLAIGLAYLALQITISLLAINIYKSSVNALTLATFYIVVYQASIGVRHNLVAWFRFILQRIRRRSHQLK